MKRSRTHIKDSEQIVVVCPIKNDNDYLIEFTNHYLKLGFDKLVFLDNNDDDSIMPSVVLKDYLADNRVDMLDCRNMNFNDTLFKYSFYCNYDFDWVLFADDDEFLELKKHASIREFLASFDADATKVLFNNMHYGDNNQIFYKLGNVMDRFPEPLPLDLFMPGDSGPIVHNSAIKTLMKKTESDKIAINSHSILDDKPNLNADNRIVRLIEPWRVDNNGITYNTAYIKHYCTKSLEEFVKYKLQRSKTNCPYYEHRFDIYSYYFMFNKKTPEKEFMAQEFIKMYILK